MPIIYIVAWRRTPVNGTRFPVEGTQEGLGLGLYITRKLVEVYGGQTWVESQEGRGNTFSFGLAAEGGIDAGLPRL